MEPQVLSAQYPDSSFTYKLTIPPTLLTINTNKTTSTETKDQAHVHARPSQRPSGHRRPAALSVLCCKVTHLRNKCKSTALENNITTGNFISANFLSLFLDNEGGKSKEETWHYLDVYTSILFLMFVLNDVCIPPEGNK